MSSQTAQLDRVFQALSDPTRRAVVDRLSRGPAPVGELAAPFAMALPSFLQHLSVLEDCGLVSSKKVGRRRICSGSAAPLAAAEGWMAQRRLVWERRLDRLDAFLEETKPGRAARQEKEKKR